MAIHHTRGMEDASQSHAVTDFGGGSSCRCVRRILGATLAVLLCAPASWAQQTHVIDKSALDQAVQQRVSQDEADREALRTFLANPAVQRVAGQGGSSGREGGRSRLDAAGR
jgi:hypothetical protein